MRLAWERPGTEVGAAGGWSTDVGRDLVIRAMRTGGQMHACDRQMIALLVIACYPWLSARPPRARPEFGHGVASDGIPRASPLVNYAIRAGAHARR